jgi:hypothetical protein
LHPKPIPRKLIEQGVGLPMKFGPPQGDDSVGDLEVLNITHPAQIRAILLGKPPPFPPGSQDFWISWWEPDEEERGKIAKGLPVRVTILGATQINPMQLDVGNNLDEHYYNEQGQN